MRYYIHRKTQGKIPGEEKTNLNRLRLTILKLIPGEHDNWGVVEICNIEVTYSQIILADLFFC